MSISRWILRCPRCVEVYNNRIRRAYFVREADVIRAHERLNTLRDVFNSHHSVDVKRFVSRFSPRECGLSGTFTDQTTSGTSPWHFRVTSHYYRTSLQTQNRRVVGNRHILLNHCTGKILTAEEIITGKSGGALLAVLGPTCPVGRGPRRPPVAAGADLEHDEFLLSQEAFAFQKSAKL